MLDSIEKITLPEHEKLAATTVKDALAAATGPFLRTGNGSDVAIPPELAHMFERLAEAAANGQEITVTVGDPRLRPREAAAALGMSRTYLCELMDAGEINFERVGTHRRIPHSEVERYRVVRAAEIAARYARATAGLPDAPDEPMEKLRGQAPRRK